MLEAKIDDFFAVEEEFKLLFPFHGVVVLKTLVRHIAAILGYLFSFDKLFEDQLELLKHAGSRKF